MRKVKTERREACRYETADERQCAELRSDRLHLQVQLLNESTVGWLVETEGYVRLQISEMLKFHSHSGWYEVEVTRVDRQNGRTQIAVRRMRELTGVSDKGPSVVSLVTRLLWRLLTRISRVTLVAVILIIGLVLFGLGADGIYALIFYGGAQADVAQDRQLLMTARLHVLSSLVSPDAKALLKLTHEQQQVIQRMVPPALSLAGVESSTPHEREETVEQAYTAVFTILTSEQRKRLLELDSLTPDAGNPS